MVEIGVTCRNGKMDKEKHSVNKNGNQGSCEEF